MINVQTLGTLLRTLQSGEVAGRTLAPLQPLAPTQAIKPISPESTQSQQTGGRDPGSGQARAPTLPGDSLPAAAAAARSSAAAIVNLASQPGRAPPATALLVDGETNPATIVTLGSSEPDGAAPRVEGRALPGTPPASPTTGPPPPAAGPGGAASLSLSAAAHLIDTLVRLPAGEPIRSPAPLAAQAVAPEVVAKALQHAIVVSGVFYESHLGRWALQSHPETALRLEPQASWPAPSAAVAPLGEPEALALPNAAAPPATPVAANAAGVPDAAPAMVRQQLDVLETGQILWRGDLWPGQPAAIDIAEDDAGRAAGQPPVWRTRLALTLPGLGAIEARLALSGQRIHLHLLAVDPQSEAALRAALPELAAALTARALEVAPVMIDHGPER